MASYSATVIVDPPELGGATTLIVNGHKFVLSGRIVRGLRALAKEPYPKINAPDLRVCRGTFWTE